MSIRPIAGDVEARACAALMSESEPWLTLRRDFAASLEVFGDPTRSTYVAVDDGNAVVGFVVLALAGAFVGYIQSVAVAPDHRCRGVGSALLDYAESLILRRVPNVFVCVSSFNDNARRLYERRGFEVVGELRDYIVRGHHEILLRRTTGPIADWRPSNRTDKDEA